MTACTPASALAAPPPLLVAVLATIVGLATAIPGKYFTNDMMTNQRLTIPLKGGTMTPTANITICQQKCSIHPQCDAYAYSGFHKTCQIYKLDKANTPVIQNMYRLFVREKTNDEGFFKYGTNYVRLILIRMNANNAAKYCAKDNGLLLSIIDSDLNELCMKIMAERKVFTAMIGLTDAAEEGTWVNSLGAEASYTNFFYPGVWLRTDRNCAFMKIDGTWSQMNCLNKQYFFCQYPMF